LAVEREHPGVFGYDPTDPALRKNIAARGRAALKALQSGEKEN